MKLHLGCGKRHLPGFVHIGAVTDIPHIDKEHGMQISLNVECDNPL